MGLFSRLRRSARAKASSAGDDADAALAHLRQFRASRQGVEAFVEPATTLSPTTVLLVAHSGEWTRRPVRDPAAAHVLARQLEIPLYDVNLVGYPQRMRDWNRRDKAERHRPGTSALGGDSATGP